MQAKTGRLLLTTAFVMALLALMSLPAMAAPVPITSTTYQLEAQNGAFSGSAPYYATVTLSMMDNKNIDFTVQAADGYTLWSTGDPLFGFNYKGSDTLKVARNDGSSLTTRYRAIGGFGKFDYTFTGNEYLSDDSSKKKGRSKEKGDGEGASLGSTISFTVTDTNGFKGIGDLIELSNVNESKDTSSLFAVHLRQTVGGNTGTAGGGTPVPEPSSLALLGAGLVSFGGLMRRYRR